MSCFPWRYLPQLDLVLKIASKLSLHWRLVTMSLEGSPQPFCLPFLCTNMGLKERFIQLPSVCVSVIVLKVQFLLGSSKEENAPFSVKSCESLYLIANFHDDAGLLHCFCLNIYESYETKQGRTALRVSRNL